MNKLLKGKRLKPGSIISFLILCIFGLITLYPFLLIVLISFKNASEFSVNPIGLPQIWTLGNYKIVFDKANILSAMRNSLTLTVISVIGQVGFGTLAAYALTKMNFKRAKLFSNLFLAPMIFPIQTVIVTLYLFYKQLHLLNSFFGLIIIYIAGGLPLVTFIFTSFMKTIPFQISESALVEGASHLRIYWQLILPLIRPAIATTIVISGLGIWNDFFLPLIMMTDRKLATLPLKIFLFQSQYATQWPLIFACIIFLVAPILVIYIFLQKHIISGVVAGSVKG